MPYEIRLLGIPEAQGAVGLVSFRSDMRYQFLAYLAYKSDWVSRDVLAYLFWSDVPTETARHNLRQLIKRLKVLSLPENLEIERERLRWQVFSDVAIFKKYLAERNLAEALANYQGEFLQGLESGEANEFHTWLFHEREMLHNKWREAVLDYVQISEKTESIKLLEKLLELDPLDEEAVQLIMGLLADTKQYAKAVVIYKSFAKRLGDELGLSPSSTSQHLFQNIEASAQIQSNTVAILDQENSASLLSTHNNLIGREIELSDIAYLLAQPQCQLITLTGLGGIGKTSLALQAMKDNETSFEQLHFIPLEAVKIPNAAPLKIAEMLNVTLQASSSILEQLSEALKDKKIMLVLDNFEHVLDSANFIGELAARCPLLKILITSRERLNLEEEYLLVVSGLALPQVTHTLEEALATASARLFFERAKRVQLHFEVGPKELPYLLRLCQRLDGVPLALELAAVWVQVMSLDEINKELSKNLDLLESPIRNRTERHRSLRAVFETSWKLLTPTEQQSFCKLAIFSGSFKRQAAVEVAGATLPDLFGFVNKSLLQTRPNGRYHIHFYIHELSLEKLRHSHLFTQTLHDYVGYYLNLLSQYSESIMNQYQKNALKELEEEIENIYEAWPYFFEIEDSDLSPAIDTLSEFLSLKGRAQEGIKLFLNALTTVSQKVRPNPKLIATLNWAIGWLFRDSGNLYQAKEYAEASLRASGAHQPIEQSRALRLLGAINRQLGNFIEAKNLFEAELEIYKRDINLKAMSFTLNHLGSLYIHLGYYAQAEEMILESIAISRNIEFHGSLVYSLQSLSTLFLLTNRFREAELTLQDNLIMAREIDCVPLIPFLLKDLSRTQHKQGHILEANQCLQEALNYALDPRNEQALVAVCTEFARINIDAGELVQAETYLLQALSIGHNLENKSELLFSLLEVCRYLFKQGKVVRGAEIAKLVFSAPMAWKTMRDYAQELLLTHEVRCMASEIPLPLTDLEQLLDDILLESQPRA